MMPFFKYHVAGWGGHCYGMSSTSILYYNYWDEQSPNIVPPGLETTFYMGLNDLDVKDTIYKYQTLCLSPELTISKISGYDIQAEYRKVDESVKAGSPINLNLWSKDDKGGHSVVAINTFEDVERNIRNVVVYDNNYPGMGTVVRFNFNSNEITYGINKNGQSKYYRCTI
jgi:hypothetical protein